MGTSSWFWPVIWIPWTFTGSWPSFTIRNPNENVPPFAYPTRTMFGPELVTGPEAKFAAERGWYRRAKSTIPDTAASTAR
jgi:hypothetical protein